jgi:hypothetical protein
MLIELSEARFSTYDSHGPLKGQCHEMVVEVRPWSGSLALN